MSNAEGKVPGWLLPVGLGVVVIGLVAIAMARGPVSLDPDTPEGTVQEYLLAISDDRWDEAVEVVHEDWRGTCDGDDLRSFDPDEFTAELGSTGDFGGGPVVAPEPVGQPAPTMPEETTTVDVTIIHGGGVGGWNEYTTFELTNQDGFWWLVGDPWPYFIWSCQGR